MKRKLLSLILTFAMTASLLTTGVGAVEPTYSDTAGHWAEHSIERWSEHGIIQGSNGQFDPNGQLTCAQLATILARLLKLPAAKDAGFTDNDPAAWYYDAINRCAAAGILKGNGDGTVTPNAPITRERSIVMLARALGIEPLSRADLSKYADAAQVSAYAQGYLAAMIKAGIVSGVTADRLAPQDNINRASTVTILDRAIGTYADKDGMTVNAKDGALVLVVAKNVKVINAPEGTEIIVVGGASDLTVNGKSVTDDQTYIVPKASTGGSSSSSSGGGYSHSYTIFETDWNTMTTVKKCSCGATQSVDDVNTYYVSSDADLMAFRNRVNAGNNFAGKTIELTKDILLTEEWTPIGDGSRNGSSYTGKAFKGTFDGKGKSISNVKITQNTANASDAIGLFGVVDGGTVKNVTLNVNIDVANNESAGGAIGLLVNNGTAEKIHVTGNVKAADGVGGIVGRMLISGIIQECVNEAVVDAGKAGSGAGGIVGKAYYTAIGESMNIQDCDNRGSITAIYCAGGIAGLSAANVADCENSASVTAGNHAGGIVGEQTNYGAVSGNTNSADIIGKNTAAGGIVGWIRYQNNDNAYPNTALITVTGNTNRGNVGKGDGTGNLGYGGIVGSLYNQGTVSGNTNNAPTITGGTFAAGIVGGPQIAADNKIIDGEVVTITNNVTTTTLDNIFGTNKDLIAWKNDESFIIDNNSETGWTVKIGETQYATLGAALAAAKDGDTVELASDVANFAGVTISKNVTIDFGPYTVTGATNAAVITVKDATVTLSGTTGGINGGSGGNNVAVWATNNCTINIVGGNYTVGGDATGSGNSTIYVNGNGTVNISGGHFSSEKQYNNKYYVLNLNNKNHGSISVTGGTFVGQNPADGDDNLGGNFVADGYFALQGENNTYTVVTADQITRGVTIQGIAGYEHRAFATVADAYNEIKPKVAALGGLGQETCSKEDFDALYNDGGKITWTIYGEQALVGSTDGADDHTFTFGRAASYYRNDCNIAAIIVKGGNDSAKLNLSGTKGTFALPYNWWGESIKNCEVSFTGITFDNIKSIPSTWASQEQVTPYTFDRCVFNGSIYGYHDYNIDLTIQNSTFNAPENTSYAVMLQSTTGIAGKVTLDGNEFNGYTRGVNLQRPGTFFIFTNNTITSAYSEPDRAAIQLTDGKRFVVTGNIVRVNAGNAFWFHNAATNSDVTYTISNNDIQAPYLGYYATSFDVNGKITSAGNKFNNTDTTKCMKKEATVAEATNLTAIK